MRVLPANGTEPIGPQRVQVRLPTDRGLQWETAGTPDHQLTVLGGTPYPGQLSPDQMALTFDNVDLDTPPGPEKVMWVAVSTGHDAPLGSTSLTLTVGRTSSPSTTIVITPGFTVTPGGAPQPHSGEDFPCTQASKYGTTERKPPRSKQSPWSFRPAPA
ncbi:hypothetical protein GCM10010507_20260 [Streptomyces cinnamoneus]|uniref:Uncharacterized protein n=1 Tax=Streptomyces cinnamoneus TaxID=53446 RepID=A0A918WF19_STRCJ|nr:hypothetical protein GCM10010507_20260 [Streptomyces cinnamoneus]